MVFSGSSFPPLGTQEAGIIGASRQVQDCEDGLAREIAGDVCSIQNLIHHPLSEHHPPSSPRTYQSCPFSPECGSRCNGDTIIQHPRDATEEKGWIMADDELGLCPSLEQSPKVFPGPSGIFFRLFHHQASPNVSDRRIWTTAERRIWVTAGFSMSE